MSAGGKETFKLDELTTLKLVLAQERLQRANEMQAIRLGEAQSLSAQLKAHLEEGGKYDLLDIALDGTITRQLREEAGPTQP